MDYNLVISILHEKRLGPRSNALLPTTVAAGFQYYVGSDVERGCDRTLVRLSSVNNRKVLEKEITDWTHPVGADWKQDRV